MKSKPIQIWGCLWMKDGSQVDLDGIVPNTIEPSNIDSFGEHELGDEANIYVIRDDGSDEILNTMADVRSFFQELKD